MLTQSRTTTINQLASKLLHFYLATGQFPSEKEHNASPSSYQKAKALLAQNGYLPKGAIANEAISSEALQNTPPTHSIKA